MMPWYIWLSALAYFALFTLTCFQFVFSKELRKRNRGNDYDLLFKGAMKNLLIGFFTMVLPPVLVTNIIFPLIAPSFGDIGDIVQVSLGLLILYFTGFYAANKHDSWRRNNL